MNDDDANRFFETSHVEHVLIVRLINDVVGYHHGDMTDELRGVVVHESPEKLIIDLNQLSFCSAEVLRGLLFARKQVTGVGGRIKVCVNERTREMFRILELDRVIEVGASVDELLTEWP